MILCGQILDFVWFSHVVLHLTIVAFLGSLITSVILYYVCNTAGVLREKTIKPYGDVLWKGDFYLSIGVKSTIEGWILFCVMKKLFSHLLEMR